VLGFVGKDWRRKGLPFLLQVRLNLQRMGMKAVVRAAGYCPTELRHEPGLEYVGYIDKARNPNGFLSFLGACDLGCLFSQHEPLGISTLEFLRAGVPVAGFAIEGPADTLPPDAGFRFQTDDSAEVVAEHLRGVFGAEMALTKMRTAARLWSPMVTWERCLHEWSELLGAGKMANPVQPWRGLDDPA
jgi:glycosyltransferase involved in cell wall biosynthesis